MLRLNEVTQEKFINLCVQINIEIHHNDNKIREDTKRDIAKQFANLLVDQLQVPIDR